MNRPRVLVVTNFATHYRAPLFELMHERLGAEFIFFSKGGEEYWQSHLGVAEGRFPGTTAVGGLSLGKFRLNTRLWKEICSRDFDILVKCINGRVELPMAYAAARRKGAAFVLWTGMWMHPDTPFHRLTRPLLRALYRRADAIVTYGDHVSRFVVSEGADPGRVFSAENATDNALYSRDVSADEVAAVRAQLGLTAGPVVLAVARLVVEKGLDVLLNAVSLLPEPRPQVLVVGTGPEAASLRQLAAALDVDLVLSGGLAPDDMAIIYAIADVFVMPSVTTRSVKETWGLACNEAMCQRVPVIATDAVGAAAGGLVIDGLTGLVVPERDVNALSFAIERVLSDKALASRLGAAGEERVRRTDYQNMTDVFQRAIGHALERRRTSS